MSNTTSTKLVCNSKNESKKTQWRNYYLNVSMEQELPEGTKCMNVELPGGVRKFFHNSYDSKTRKYNCVPTEKGKKYDFSISFGCPKEIVHTDDMAKKLCIAIATNNNDGLSDDEIAAIPEIRVDYRIFEHADTELPKIKVSL